MTYDGTIPHTCKRCGYCRNIDATYQRKFEAKDPARAGLCLDCRGLEQNRTRPTYVPNDVILDIVAKMKEGQSV
jgi:hypothetical protein